MNGKSVVHRLTSNATTDQRTAAKFVLDCFSPDISSAQISHVATTVDWGSALQFAGDHLVSPALILALKRRELLNDIDDAAVDALEMILQANRLRNEQMLKACSRMASTLQVSGVQWLPLKGMALLMGGVYADIGERILSDIDIYIPPASIPEALRALRDAGYSQITNVNDPARVFTAAGYMDIDVQDRRNTVRSVGYQLPVILDSELDVYFEVHHRIVAGDTPLGDWLNKTAHSLTMAGTAATVEGELRGFDFHFLHNLYHSQIKDACYYTGHLDLRHLLDLTRLLDQPSPETECDGRPLLELARSLDIGPVFNCFVQTAKELMGAKVCLWDDITERERNGRARYEWLRSHPWAGHVSRWRIKLTRYLSYLLSRDWLAQFYGDLPAYQYPYRLARYFVNKVYLWVRRKL